MADEIDETVMHNNGVSSPPTDEDNNGGNVGPNGPLKKGPWTSAEDAILVEYVTKHGEGNWNAVQKHSGLARCGKSCRLRWANHLRPDLKKGAFSEEEEKLIIELHAKMGNKWARMAAELPGRTDNEIKNFWNTRIKRKQRAGLPIYPPEICFQALNDNQKTDDAPTFSINDAHYPDFMPVNSFEIPAVEFKALEMNAPPLLDVPSSSLLEQGLESPYANQPWLSTTHHHPSKRLRRSSYFFPNSNATHLQNDSSLQIAQSFRYPSSSEPNWATKLELPSLQTPPSPLPSLESVDTLIQMPPNENAMPCNPSPRNNGLLEAVLYESQNMKCSKKTSLMDTVNETGLEACGELLSPIGHSSSSSIFSGSTPISGNSFDEPESIETTGSKVKDEPNTFISMHYDHKIEKTNPMIFMRPDFLLASDCFPPTNDLDSCLGKRCYRDTW